jgi:hypothetical protein
MNTALFEKLGAALRQRNPELADRLQPGLSENRIRRKLERIEVRGSIEPIVSLFAWKNGVNNSDQALSGEQASLFPKSIYLFTELDMMAADFQGFKECMEHHPAYAKVVGRYFPLFWDGSNSWLGVDLNSTQNSRLVLIHTEFEQMVFQAYDSFEEFLNDAIRAIEENVSLACFDSLKPVS